MKKTLIPLAVMSLTVSSMAAVPYPGDIIFPLTISLSATYESDSYSSHNPALLTHTEHSVKITSATILEWAGAALSQDLTGDSLQFDSTQSALFAVDKETGEFIDLSSLATVTLPSTWISSGTDNADTGVGTLAQIGAMSINFDDGNGNSFSISGLIHQSAATKTSSGSYTFSFTGTGSGDIVAKEVATNAVFTGTVGGSTVVRY